MSRLKGKKVLLGIGGGIAAYKSCEIVRRLTDAGAEVHVVMTEAGQKFVTPLTFQCLSQNPVHTDLFDLTEESEMGHIKLADEVDVVLVAPATADLIAKIACGLAGDLLTTLLLVTRAPVFLAPSMNVNMWEKEVVQKNIQTLKDRAYHIIEPEEGYLACGWEGKGRLVEPENILQTLEKNLKIPSTPKKKSLQDKRILINAGPTREYLDPVRFLSNPSSGKMGFALAAEAQARGAKVTLITGPVALEAPRGIQQINITTAEEMYEECRKVFPKSDVFIATAAVGDYRPKVSHEKKIKKSKEPLHLELIQNRDILQSLAQEKRNGQVLVGFAAETEDLLKYAQEKLTKKNLDLIVANDVSKKGTGFGSDYNQVLLIDRKGGKKRLNKMLKTEIAKKILDHVQKLFSTD